MDALDELYIKETYLDKYGGSVIMTIVILLIFFVAWSYYYVKGSMKSIKANWPNERCKPSVLPFAGMINAPSDANKMEYTEKNFGHCTQSVLTTITSDLNKSLNYATSLVHNVYADIEKALQNLRNLSSRMREDATSFTDKVYNRILNVLTSVQYLVIKIRAIINKTTGVMTTSLLTTFGAYLGLQSMLGAFVKIIIIVLIIIAAFVMIMWAVLAFPPAIAGTAVFVAVAVPLGIIMDHLKHIIDLTGDHIPSKPACFDKNTIIPTKKGFIMIKNIQPGDILLDGSVVTGIFELSAIGLDMYNYNGVVVSGSHIIRTNDGDINVRDHPNSIRRHNYTGRVVYCLNTSSKLIRIGKTNFLDWDELTNNELYLIQQKLYNYDINKKNINSQLDGGFVGSTRLVVKNKGRTYINEINVGDVLSTGEKILGIVTILPNTIKKLTFNGKQPIYGGPNLQISDPNLGNLSSLQWPTYTKSSENLYHVITDTDYVHIEGIKFCDFNGSLDQLINHE